MPHRRVVGLVFAEQCPRPKSIPVNSKPRGVKAKGLSFERAAAKALPGAKHGLWFMYTDANGRGYCSPDLLLETPKAVFVFECKLSNVDEARSQLSELYLPVVGLALAKPAFGIVLVKAVTREKSVSLITDSVSKACLLAQSCIPTLHWLGRGPLPHI
jgi:hypothetical protein